ncbi:type IV pilus secretin PilQ [Burkholderia sp. WAC0059]|uniref:type IV pilus secretin PilQ n=1 Tax=Burkholderia sp. WAC0059 TaxID=2066022 RepID=UPI000C7EB4DC|nr:type IV pilus secretin PilQ [Burkholderia sp. WAC0059]PLZ01344.1 type IV pilus secretin PilQ [Burkholderia sp. WAC0059]
MTSVGRTVVLLGLCFFPVVAIADVGVTPLPVWSAPATATVPHNAPPLPARGVIPATVASAMTASGGQGRGPVDAVVTDTGRDARASESPIEADAASIWDSSDSSAELPATGSAPPATPVGAEDAAMPAGRAAATTDEPLEGPPTPMSAVRRLSDSVRADELPPDRPISLNFEHADIPAVLHAFADFTRLNIVANERVHGQVTLRLDRVPWRTAFDLLLEANGLAMERFGKVIWVTPAAEMAAREKQRFEAHAKAAELEPLASRAFELHYAHAEDLRRLLTGSGNQRALSKRGSAVADARTNLLFVTDLAARLEQIADLVAKLDRPARQVQIEARIVEGDQGLSRNLGVRLAMAVNGGDGGPARGLQGAGNGTVYDFAAGPLSGFDAAQIGLSLLAARATRLLDVELSALEAEGRGRVVSSPRVVTADHMRAIVEQGTELPYQAKVSQGVSGVQFRRASLKLEVEPQITPGGRVVLDLDVAKDSVGEQTANGPAINTKHVQTRVEIEDGGTVSIGGIDATDDRDDMARVPLLGRIPLLGALFSRRMHRRQRSELVVFITPRIVHAN